MFTNILHFHEVVSPHVIPLLCGKHAQLESLPMFAGGKLLSKLEKFKKLSSRLVNLVLKCGMKCSVILF